ncbi:MAG: hypothetical protein MI799_09960 [Desulfobacterales bacterium]|nr:hypothetical protein [Desulfobacterales bacterium]
MAYLRGDLAFREVLANLMPDYQIKGKRLLEVGCGIALASLVLNQRAADITATDHQSAARDLLDYNVDLNNGHGQLGRINTQVRPITKYESN